MQVCVVHEEWEEGVNMGAKSNKLSKTGFNIASSVREKGFSCFFSSSRGLSPELDPEPQGWILSLPLCLGASIHALPQQISASVVAPTPGKHVSQPTQQGPSSTPC